MPRCSGSSRHGLRPAFKFQRLLICAERGEMRSQGGSKTAHYPGKAQNVDRTKPEPAHSLRTSRRRYNRPVGKADLRSSPQIQSAEMSAD